MNAKTNVLAMIARLLTNRGYPATVDGDHKSSEVLVTIDSRDYVITVKELSK